MQKRKIKIVCIVIAVVTMLLSLNSIVTATQAINGDGSKNTPYIINMDNASLTSNGNKYIEISYKDNADFYFKIEGDKSSGTYCVEYDEEAKTVRFIYINNNNVVCYYRPNQNSEYYIQAGTSPKVTTSDITYDDVRFKIETIETCDGTIFYTNTANDGKDANERKDTLKNAPLPSEPDVPHPSYFVFTKSGTAEELFDSVSKANCEGTAFEGNRVNYSEVSIFSKNVADLVIDPRIAKATTDGNITPTKVIRYATWNGGNSVSEQGNYKVNVLYHFIGQDDKKEENASAIESAVTKILCAVGDIFLWAIKSFLGSDLTIDAIIFNRYEATVIDFRGRAGMFANADVKSIINTMYSGFEWLAIIAFVVVLLYLGIQIVITVGTDKQSKYFKNLENWVIGVAILFIFPRFFPYISDITNGIVSYLGKDASPMYSQYNVMEILGITDESILGEDAETAAIKRLIEDKISANQKLIEELEKKITSVENKNKGWLNKLFAFIWESIGYNSDKEEEIIKYVDDNYTNWSYINDEEFENMISEHEDTNQNILTIEHAKEITTTLRQYKANKLEIKKLQDQIEVLQNYESDAGKDLMSAMRAKAGATGRIVYAIVWLVLIFQMITLLAMYYKRIIMISILLMIFPIVMIAYAIDKINDGKAQTFETWTKEFTVNITVQVAHAVVYVFLIQTGLDIYQSNPDNWIFLFLAVMILFPMERMFRTLFGINGNTIGSLKANIVGGVAAAGLAYKGLKSGGKLAIKGGKGAYNLGKELKNNGIKKVTKDKINKVKNAFKDYGSKEALASSARDRKRQAVADRKKNARSMNIQRRREQMEKAGLAKKTMLKTINAASMVRNGMYRLGNAGRKVKRGMHNVQNSFAGKSFKLASTAIRKGAGLAFGIASGATNAVISSGKNGMAAGIVEGHKIGTTVSSIVGGKGKQKQEPEKKVPTMNNMPLKRKKNMPGNQQIRTRTPAYQKVKNKTTKNKTTKARIKGVKKNINYKEK